VSANNGIIRIGRKGLKKFAFGDDGPPFEVDVVVAFRQWIDMDERFRPEEEDAEGNRSIPTSAMQEYHRAAVEFVQELATVRDKEGREVYVPSITVAETLDFLARLREQYDELTVFFRVKSRVEPDSPVTSGVEHRFSEEAP
jgi:hypothetical protein